MKTKLRMIAGVAALATVAFFSMPERAAAQAGRVAVAPGTPPIGRLCEVTVLASVYSNKTDTISVNGTLLAMTDKWLVLQDGSFENWVPMDRVVVMRASR